MQTKSIPSRAATTQGDFGCDVARVARAGWGGASAASNLAALGGAMNSGGRLFKKEIERKRVPFTTVRKSEQNIRCPTTDCLAKN